MIRVAVPFALTLALAGCATAPAPLDRVIRHERARPPASAFTCLPGAAAKARTVEEGARFIVGQARALADCRAKLREAEAFWGEDVGAHHVR